MTRAAGPAPGWLVHGMGRDLAEPDWSPLTTEEVRAVLARYGPGLPGAGGAVVTWRSPRPMSAAGLARLPGGATVFAKRHAPRVRTAGQLAAEHAFIGHLRGRGVPVPAVGSAVLSYLRERASRAGGGHLPRLP